jgi:hypothetical protein
MLPFDNKSEFQVIVDMPNGTTLEQTRACVQLLGEDNTEATGGRQRPDLRRNGFALQLQRSRAPLLSAPAAPMWRTFR